MRIAKILFAMVLIGLSGGVYAQTWPNEPAGSTNLLDWNFSTREGNGWTCYCADMSVVSDGTAPHSPSSVGQWRYNVGMPGGISAGNLYRSLPSMREIYVGYWWKASAGFQGHPSNVNKMLFLVGGGNFVPEMYGAPGGPYRLMLCLEAGADNCHLSSSFGSECPGTRMVSPNAGSATLIPGNWYRIELYLKHSSTPTSKDGVLRAWLNGSLTHNFTTVNSQASSWTELQINPTWGGTGGTINTTSYFWYDHFRISKPNGGVVEPVMPLSIATTSLPSARAGSPYSATLQASSGKAPYGWTITSGSLLQGLLLNKTTGVISGTPAAGGRCDFTVKVLDSNVPAKEASKAFSIIASGSAGITAFKADQTIGGVEVSAGKVRFVLPLETHGDYRINVFDLSGKSVFSSKAGAANQKEISTHTLKDGVYFAAIHQGGQQSTFRFSVVE